MATELDDPFAGLDFDNDDDGADDEKEDQAPDVTAQMQKLAENQRKIAQKIAADDAARKVENLKNEFYATADDTQKELASIFLEGTETVTEVERAIKLIKTKAGVAPKKEPAADEGDDDSDSFVPPATGQQRDKSPDEQLTEQLKKGTLPFNSFLETFRNAPVGEWSEKNPQ